jgi:hypothetical protein
MAQAIQADGKPPLKLIVHFSVESGCEVFVGDSRHLLISSEDAGAVVDFLHSFQAARSDTIFEFSTPYEATKDDFGFEVARRLSESQIPKVD